MLSLVRASPGTRTVIWLAFFIAAFVTTHMPAPKHAPPLINDKLLHFSGFLLLSLLSVWRMAEPGVPIRRATIVIYLAGLAIYGIVDETTQPFMGRDCEFFDWVADCGGAIAGLALGVWTHRGTQPP